MGSEDDKKRRGSKYQLPCLITFDNSEVHPLNPEYPPLNKNVESVQIFKTTVSMSSQRQMVSLFTCDGKYDNQRSYLRVVKFQQKKIQITVLSFS